MSRNHNNPYQYAAIFFFLISLVAIQSCSLNDTGSVPKMLSPGLPRYDACQDFDFEWDQRLVRPGRELGRGVFGVVHELKSEGWSLSEIVLKIIKGRYHRRIEQMAYEELRLAEELPEIYTPTALRGIFQVEDSRGNKSFMAHLVKKRVNGFMLSELVDGRLATANLNHTELVATFEKFHQELVANFVELSRRDVFVWDLNDDNIMFDTIEKKWYLVDAKLHESWNDFVQDMKIFNSISAADSPLDRMKKQIEENAGKLPQDRKKFFETYLQIELGKPLAVLRRHD